MFQNYSQTYASQILALAGFIEIIGNQFGWSWAESDILLVLGVAANIGGIIWALTHRASQGDINPLGVRKVSLPK